LSPKQTSAGGAELYAKGGESNFAAGARTLKHFPQTGHSPRNGGNQPTNDWVADEAAIGWRH